MGGTSKPTLARPLRTGYGAPLPHLTASNDADMEVSPMPLRPRTIVRADRLASVKSLVISLLMVLLLLPTPILASASHALAGQCRGVRVSPRDDVQALVDNHPQRTTFCFANGTYRLSATIWTGQKFPTFDLRSGALIDGQNGGFTGISGVDAPAGRRGAVILGGTFQHFGNANGPSWVAPVILSAGWVVKGSEFRENFNSGLVVQGDDARVSNVHTHHNGRYGLTVGGQRGVVVENSEIAYNNTRQLDPGYDAGGTKFAAGTSGTVVRRNKIHHNYGSGVWFDSLHKNARIYRNKIYENYRWGIFWEASYGGVKIHHNSLSGNGIGDGSSNPYNGQIVVADSDGGASGIEIFDNEIVGSAYPIALIDGSDRSGSTRSVAVRDNVMTLQGDANLVGGFGVDLFSSDAKNRFERNTYRVRDRDATLWAWNGQTLTWRGWRDTGHDRDGRLRVIG